MPATVTYDADAAPRRSPDRRARLLDAYTGRQGGAVGVKDAAGNAMAADFTWTFTTRRRRHRRPPGRRAARSWSSPRSANPFSTYYAEILRAEGLNAFATADLSAVTATTLAGYDVVDPRRDAADRAPGHDVHRLGERRRQPDRDAARQAARRPARPDRRGGDARRRVPAGRTRRPRPAPASSTRRCSSTARPTATRSNGATSGRDALLERDDGDANPGGDDARASAPTADRRRRSPTTWRGRSSTRARATRPGRARSATASTPIRSDDLFFGAKAGDVAARLGRPRTRSRSRRPTSSSGCSRTCIADDEPATGSRCRGSGTSRAMLKAVVDHDRRRSRATAARPDASTQYIAASPAGCSVADWECIRGTSYIYPSTPLDQRAGCDGYVARASRSACTSTPDCADYTPATLEDFYARSSTQFATAVPEPAAPVTNRTHCIAWSD